MQKIKRIDFITIDEENKDLYKKINFWIENSLKTNEYVAYITYFKDQSDIRPTSAYLHITERI